MVWAKRFLSDENSKMEDLMVGRRCEGWSRRVVFFPRVVLFLGQFVRTSLFSLTFKVESDINSPSDQANWDRLISELSWVELSGSETVNSVTSVCGYPAHGDPHSKVNMPEMSSRKECSRGHCSKTVTLLFSLSLSFIVFFSLFLILSHLQLNLCWGLNS